MKKSKKILIALLLAALMTVIALTAGCGGNDDPGTDTGKTAAPADKTAAPEEKDAYVFKKGDVTIKMNAPAEPIISALGEPDHYYEEASCAFEGMDKTYTYGSIDVTTYTLNGADYIAGVVLWDDSVETPEGLYIGARAEDVARIYGEDATGKTSVSLKKGDANLLILLKDGVVTSIQYLAIN
jgi:hypothetical protein